MLACWPSDTWNPMIMLMKMIHEYDDRSDDEEGDDDGDDSGGGILFIMIIVAS